MNSGVFQVHQTLSRSSYLHAFSVWPLCLSLFTISLALRWFLFAVYAVEMKTGKGPIRPEMFYTSFVLMLLVGTFVVYRIWKTKISRYTLLSCILLSGYFVSVIATRETNNAWALPDHLIWILLVLWVSTLDFQVLKDNDLRDKIHGTLFLACGAFAFLSTVPHLSPSITGPLASILVLLAFVNLWKKHHYSWEIAVYSFTLLHILAMLLLPWNFLLLLVTGVTSALLLAFFEHLRPLSLLLFTLTVIMAILYLLGDFRTV